jgi:ElaB/YqjD/DUF883 family membrane-anchored ribosome-binding protein
MEAKRASLSDKLDALENQVLETAHEATSAVNQIAKDVTDVVDNVTEDIQETVQSVKDAFDIGEKIRQNPWASLAGAFAVGFAGAYLTGSSKRSEHTHSGLHFPKTNGFAPQTEPARAFAAEPAKEPANDTSDTTSGLASLFGTVGTEAMNKIKGLAVGTLMGVLAEALVNAVPTSLKSEVTTMMTDLNTQLGGKALFTLDKSEQGNQPAEQAKGEANEYGNKAEVGRPMGSTQGTSQEPVGQSDRRRTETGRRRL